MEYIKKQILHERKIGDRQLVINDDGTIELNPSGGTVTITGNLRVTGTSSGPVDPNVYYVSLQGSDDNDGLAAGPDRAKRTIKSAVEAAPPGATIHVAAGDYYENNPITLKERQTVRGDSLRNTQIYPINNQDDIFFVDNACYLFQLTFRALRDPGWCVRIKPGALVTVSPYVQNCTNMNGPWLNDGTEFTPFVTEQIPGVTPGARPIIDDPAVPFAKRVNETGGGNGMLVDGNEYDQRSLVFSMVADAFTQIAQGGIGFHITNFGYTQIVSCFSVFTRIGFFATKGGYLSISNSVSDFGTFAIISDGVFDEIYTTARPSQDYASSIGSITVNSSGAGYSSVPTVVIDPPESPTGIQATAVAAIDPTRGELTGITVLNQGSGYLTVPNIQLLGGGFTVAGIATANLLRNTQIEVNSLRDVPQTGSVIRFAGDDTFYYVTNTDITVRPFIYDENICRRDVRRIVDAVMGDVTLGTNYQAIAAGRSYLRATSQKVLFQQLQPTIFGIEAARDEILDRIPDSDPANEQLRYDIIERFAEITAFIANEDSSAAPDIFYKTETATSDGHNNAKDTLLLNKDFIVAETIEYIKDQFTELSYNQDKCERDVILLTDAIVADVRLGTNYNTITAGLSYLRANANRVIERQLAITLDAFNNVKNSMLALGAVASNPIVTARVNALFAEFFDIVEGAGYNQATCRRDLGYIFDSVQYDSLLGTNYNSVTAGLSYERAPSAYVRSNQFQQTVRAIELARDLSIAAASSNATAQTRVQDNFNEVLDILTISDSTQDTSTINRVVFSDPGPLYQNKTYAREQIQTNRAFIISELIAWITANYPSLIYDQTKCERDTGFILDAVSFDVQYGGNFATRRAADAYFSYAVAQLPADQRAATAAAYNQLAVIVSSVIIETYPGQDTSGNPATATEQTELTNLIQIIEDVITANSLSGLPTLVEPITVWVNVGIDSAIDDLLAQESTIIDTVISEINVSITNADTIVYPNPPGTIANRINAKQQLLANKAFIQEDVVQFVNNNYPTLDYNISRCRRDVGYIVDALIYDLLYESNTATLINARSYFVGAASQLGDGETLATVAAYNHMQGLVVGVILESAIAPQAGNTLTQDTSGSPGSSVEADKSSNLIGIIKNVIQEGDLTSLPAEDSINITWVDEDTNTSAIAINSQKNTFATQTTAYILANYPDFTYDREKCRRDVQLILDALVRDVNTNSNHFGLVAGLAYRRASANVVDAQQLPATIIALREAKRLSLTYVTNSATVTQRLTQGWDNVLEIIEYGTVPSEGYTYPAPTPASQEEIDTTRQLQQNKEFLIEEVIAFIANNYFIYDSAKCRRDSDIILKAVTDDLLMGTNYNTVISGLAYYNANAALVISDQLTETVAAITKLKSESLSYITDDATSTATIGALFDEIIDIVQNGVLAANALTFSNPLSNTNATNARTLLQLNRTFVTNELISWINSNYPTLDYDQTKCERDTGYLIDAISHDVQYETNQATLQAARTYFVGIESQLPYDTRSATAAAYNQLGSIISDIVQESYSGQVTNGSPASATEGSYVAGLAELVSDVIDANTIAILPTAIPLNLSGTSASAIDSAEDIYITNKTNIINDTIDFINFTLNGFSYDEDRCRRDTGYLIESTSFDQLYGGNISSLLSARAYFDGNANQIPGQEGVTVQALQHLRDVAADVVQGIAVVPTTGNTETQSLVGGFGTSVEAQTVIDLLDITIDAIIDGNLGGTPSEIEPDTSWVSPAISETIGRVSSAKATIANNVITFITDNIISFEYNQEKCERDTKYIFDAALYDMLYGGNKQTRRAAEAYYGGAILGAARVGNADQIEITEFTYKHLAKIMSDISKNITITKTSTNPLNQVYGAIAGSDEAAQVLFTNIEKIGDVVKTYVLPAEIDHFYSTQGITFNNTKRELILADLQAVEDGAIRALNLEYGGVATLTLFPPVTSVAAGTLASMQNVSTVSTSGHAFEYVGAGITYNALPFFGGSAISENEFVEQNQGKVFAGGTVDQIGNFKVGNFFTVNALTGEITLNAEEINLNGIASIGPFRRFGIPVGVELKEVSNSFDLSSSTGAADINTVPTQVAVKEYVENRYLNKLTGGTVTGNIVLNGDFDVNGNVISTDTIGEFNLLNTSATTINAFGAATAINIGADSGLITLSPDVLVQGSLTVNGDIVFTGDVSLNIPDESLQAYSISTEGSLDYISINTRTNSEQITFGIRPTFLVENTTEATSVDSASVVFDGGLGVAKSIIVGGDLTVDGSIILGDDRAIDTIDINGSTDIDLPDNSVGVFVLRENITEYLVLDTTDDAEVIKFGQVPYVSILNQNETTDATTGALQVVGGISSQRNIHAGVDLVADRDIIADRDIQVNGTNIITDETGVFNVFNTNATTINAFGAATVIDIGSNTGVFTINNEQVIINSVQTLQIPVGNTLDRPTAVTGQIRFNTDTTVFEGYDGIAWGSLGGVKDVDQNTFIRPETSPGANNNELEFFTDGDRRLIIGNNLFRIEATNPVEILNDTQSNDYQTGALTIQGGVGIAKNLHVQGFIGGNNSGILQLTNLASDKIIIKADTIESPEQLRFITGADDSSGNEIIYPISLVNRSDGGSVVAGAGTGIKFEIETQNDNFEVSGVIDVVAQDITGAQEDFDMVFRTMNSGATASEKLRLSETVSTFAGDLIVQGDDLTTTQTTFNLLNVTTTTVNFGGAATAINIGATGGLTTIDQNVQVNEDVTIDGTLALTNIDLEVQYGGTGVSTFTADGILYGNTAGPVQVTDAAGTSDVSNSFQILTVVGGGDNTPVWTDTIDGGSF